MRTLLGVLFLILARSHAQTLQCEEVRSQYQSNGCCTSSADKPVQIGVSVANADDIVTAYHRYNDAFIAANYTELDNACTRTAYISNVRLGETGLMSVGEFYRQYLRGPLDDLNYATSIIDDVRVFKWNTYAQLWSAYTRYDKDGVAFFNATTWYFFMKEDNEWKLHLI